MSAVSQGDEDVWASFPVFPGHGGAGPQDRTTRGAAGGLLDFPEWDAGGFRRPTLPVGLVLPVADVRADAFGAGDGDGNTALRAFVSRIRASRRPANEQSEEVVAYFVGSHVLMARLARVRNGTKKFMARLQASFGVAFSSAECGMLAMLADSAGLDGKPLETKAGRRARRHADAAARAAAERAEAARRAAEAEEQFQQKAACLASGGDAAQILEFVLLSKRFAGMVGCAFSKGLQDFADDGSPTVTWSHDAALPLVPEVQDGVAERYAGRWQEGRAAHLLHCKRSQSALKGAETRRRNLAEKVRAEHAAILEMALAAREQGTEALLGLLATDASVHALLEPVPGIGEPLLTLTADELSARRLKAEEAGRARRLMAEGQERAARAAMLCQALAARERGPDALSEFLAANPSVLPLLTLTEDEKAADRRRQQACIDRQGIWRKDVLARCPWLRDSEIEPLLRQGHIVVLRTQTIRKHGTTVEARLYDPASVRKLTREWVETWRAGRRRS